MSRALHSRIADVLARLGSLARSHENREAQAEGLSPLQAHALVVLLHREGIRVGELAKELLVSYGTLSASVSTLEDKGLVVKYVDPEEHRAVNLELTTKGRTAARRAESRASELLAAPVSDLEPDQAANLLVSLLELLRTLERRGSIAAARMCLTCRHFERDGGDATRPHYCHLLDEPIGEGELRVDCPEHEVAAPGQRPA